VDALVYSHHHADHGRWAGGLVRGGRGAHRGMEGHRRMLAARQKTRPGTAPGKWKVATLTTLVVAGDRVDARLPRPNHSPDNIIIHFPGPDAPCDARRDIANPGWCRSTTSNLTRGRPDTIERPRTRPLSTLESNTSGGPSVGSHPFDGHSPAPAVRRDNRRPSAQSALGSVDPTGPYFVKYCAKRLGGRAFERGYPNERSTAHGPRIRFHPK